jgi:hypothetical protein
MAAHESVDLARPGEAKSLLLRAEESRRAPKTGPAAATAGAGEIVCDQVIFTSVRTPMGEGYRIIAATSGMKPDERQAITQNAPSHDALCNADAQASAMAFYTLPTGRLCVAHSSCAGSEHTGRGGHRVYTISVVFDAAQFSRAAFNPFNVLRAMQQAGLTTPTLKPPPELPKVTLQTAADGAARAMQTYPIASLLDGPTRQYVVSELLSDTKLVVCIDGDYLAAAEALLMALPGPMRTKISLAAGLRFSVARSYRLSIVAEDAATEARVSGQPIRLLKRGAPAPPAGRSEWLSFVDGYLEAGRIGELAARTSRPFQDTSPNARQRLAKLFTTLDTLDDADIARLVAVAVEFVGSSGNPEEKLIQSELLTRTLRLLQERLGGADALAAARHWSALVEIWRRSPEAAVYIQPVVDTLLRRLSIVSPCDAAESALAIARNAPDSLATAGHAALLDDVVERYVAFARIAEGDEDRRRAEAVARKWQSVRPGCKLIAAVLATPPAQPKGPSSPPASPPA